MHTSGVHITLHEPPKDVVLAFPANGPVDREAFIILLDTEQGRTYEAVVSLSRQAVVSWDHIPDVQPAIMLDEFLECEQACKASPTPMMFVTRNYLLIIIVGQT